MSTARESEVANLRRVAEDLAKQRGERATTGHLLAAIATKRSAAADLLKERRLDAEVLLKAARVVTDDARDALARTVERAIQFASRAQSQEPGAMHLLFALCQERQTAAHRALEQCGTDVTKLRVAAMQLATGIAPPRRVPQKALQTTLPLQRLAPTPTQVRATPQAPAKVTPAPNRVPHSPSSNRLPPPPAPYPMKGEAQQNTPTPLSPCGRGAGGEGSRVAGEGLRTAVEGSRVSGEGARSRKRHIAGPAPRNDRGARFELDPKQFPTLAQIGNNLTAMAARGELDPVVGRDEEIERTLDVLAKRHANNPCLVGVAGVGKTSVVRGIAQRIAEGTDVKSLDDRIVIEIEPTALIGGTGVRGALAERIVQIKAEVMRSNGRIVVFFDEMHTLFGGEAGEEAAGELKIALSRGELPCIGATTIEEYKRAIDSDAALSRRFTAIEVVELSPEAAFLALEQVAPAFAKHHGTTFSQEALAASVTWSVRYLPGKALPDKAVGIVDLAGARARRRGVKNVTHEQIAEVVAELADVPIERLLETDHERMLRLESILAETIVGHTSALARIAAVLRRNASGFRSKRPIGSFLLLGPTGVGKTETAKAIAQCLFQSPDAMTRLDLSEYAEAHAIARLVGAPPGYVGHEAGGQLTESVRRRPYQVILLDEIEKAHRDVLESFLQVFDEGRLTDGRGRTIDFTNVVVILTSNLGSEVSPRMATKGKIGFAARDQSDAMRTAYEEAVIASARAALPPELYNRLDEVLTFAPLSRLDVAEVARRMLAGLAKELMLARGVKLDASEAAIEALLDAGGFDPELGARPMRRAIGRHVEAPIAEMILRGVLSRGDVATVDAEGAEIVVDAVTPSTAVATRAAG
jgi:ATP-dependent Clp protease ATP-binding subunit ClpC